MTGDFHVRFCGNAGVKFPCVTRLCATKTKCVADKDIQTWKTEQKRMKKSDDKMTMKKVIIVLSVFVLIASSCGQRNAKAIALTNNDEKNETPQEPTLYGNYGEDELREALSVPTTTMTMTTDSIGLAGMYLYGTGYAVIDWGDGKRTVVRLSDSFGYNYKYTNTAPRTITITGADITVFYCSGNIDSRNRITSLDVGKNMALTSLDCSDNLLTSLNVTNNTSLTDLTCVNNKLKSLNINKNLKLTQLWCYNNQITALNVSRNTALKDFRCYENRITDLDVSSNTALTYLDCHSNQLTSLNVSGNTVLTNLDCSDNQLNSLDISNSTAMTSLMCDNNRLTSLDVRSNTALTSLGCSNNQLISFDVTSNTALTDLVCSDNQLTYLELSKDTVFHFLDISNNQLVAAALDTIFKTLYVNTHEESGFIRIGGNPGTSTCNRRIATNKRWGVGTDEIDD